jgi:hypothetical protein
VSLRPPWLRVSVYAPRIHFDLSGWLVQSGLGRFLLVPEDFGAVLGQLGRWLYPMGPGAHCNKYYYYYYYYYLRTHAGNQVPVTVKRGPTLH